MSSIAIISAIFALLVLLIGYAFIHHAVEKRVKRRRRLLTALKHRQRSFKHMISSLPPGFLTKDLTLIIYRALLEASEQLSQLEPKESEHKEDCRQYSAELEEIKYQGEEVERGRLENPGQLGDIKQLLQELYRFVALQSERGNLTQAQGRTYTAQLKRLALQATVDAHAASARQAQGAGKPRLAIHYYKLARELLLKENGGQDYQKQLDQLGEIERKLETQVTQQTQPEQSAGAAQEEQKEWDQLSEESTGWKKKPLYD